MVVQGQYKALIVGIWLYLVSRGRRWLFLGVFGSVSGGIGCQCDMLSENIWFTFYKPSEYSIFGEGKSDHGQTNRTFYLRLDSVEGVE